MTKDIMQNEVARLLVKLDQKIVFAESCTGGLISATLAQIPGISDHLCGSLVTYRARSKLRWLGVSKKTIKAYTTESKECAIEMALGALRNTPEANWSTSIVGHFGPNAPSEKDGMVYICVARRTNKGKLKAKEMFETGLSNGDRVKRQKEATSAALEILARTLLNWAKKPTTINRKERK